MSQIFTLTCNLLAQTYASFDSIAFGKTYRIKEKNFSVGGKGINVSKALKKFGLISSAVFFYGGNTGKKCLAHLTNVDELDCIGVQTNFETRAGLVAFDKTSKKETTFLGEDSPLSDADFLRAISEIESRATCGDILAFCGSCPDWSEAKKAALLNIKKRKNLRLVLDTYGAPLKDLFFEESEILKINADEFSAFCACEKSEIQLDENFKKFAQKTRSNFFAITNSSQKVRARFNGEIRNFLPPQFEGASFETGCGDIVLARLIYALAKNGNCNFSDLNSALELASTFAQNPSL